MLNSDTKEQWDICYNKALKVIEADPRVVEKLVHIGQSESYYAGYYLKNIEGNLGLRGSSPVESNHSSNVAHLGKGASWSISEHIAHLFNRQQHLYTLELQEENDYYVSTLKYQSDFEGQSEMDDIAAKKCLTRYAHEKLFLDL